MNNAHAVEIIKTLHNQLYAINVRPYRMTWRASEKDLAQEALSGKTHYVDNDTLRYFSARILETRQDDNGLFFALRESVQHPVEGRVQRWVVFDVFGNYERSEFFKTAKQSEAKYTQLTNGVEWIARTRDVLVRTQNGIELAVKRKQVLLPQP